MEKYSAYRVSIRKPFLNPVPPNAPSILAKTIQLFGYIQGVVRTTLIIVVGVLHFFIVEVVLLLLVRMPMLMFLPCYITYWFVASDRTITSFFDLVIHCFFCACYTPAGWTMVDINNPGCP
jgi:hypothetical protein